MPITIEELRKLKPVTKEDEERSIKEEKKEYMQEWREKNREKIKEYMKQNYEENVEEKKEYGNQYYVEHKKEMREYSNQYREENKEKLKLSHAEYLKTEAGKAIQRKADHKRRDLGFIPLNKSFPGSVYHHVDKEHVICIPVEMHRSVYHNVFTGENMEEINDKAFRFLGEENNVRSINEAQLEEF